MLIDSEQLDVEDKGGAAGYAKLGKLSVAHLGGDIDLPSVADVHLLHGDDPSLDEVAQPARQGHVATAAVESRPIDGLARVMGGNHIAGHGRRTRCVSLGQHLVINAPGQRLHAVFQGLRHQPISVGLYVLIFCLFFSIVV